MSGPSAPSSDLYAYARFCEHNAAAISSIGHAGDHWKMHPADWQRHLEAKARLFGRAGDAAAAVADGGPGEQTMAETTTEATT